MAIVPTARAQSSCDGSDGAYLYEGEGYQGMCVRFTEDVPDLNAYDLDNTVSSIRIIGAWTATLFADKAYQGETSTFIGNAASLLGTTIGDNRASSLRVAHGRVAPVPSFNICDGGNGVYLYEHPNYFGRCVKFTQDELDLRRLAFDDTASSIRIVGYWRATLYADLNGSGASMTLGQDTPSFVGDVVGDNQATSIRVERLGVPVNNTCDGGEGVYLYEHPSYLGRCIKFTSDAPDLRVFDFDDTASSIRIVGTWKATLFRDLDGAGPESTFTQDNPGFVNDVIGDNQTTSLRVQHATVPQEHICAGVGVYLYADPGFLGRCVKLTGDAPDLRVFDLDDTISSIRIVGNWTATLYRDPNWTGESSTFRRGHPNLALVRVGDNQVTSVRVRPS